ncbi:MULTISPECIES: hypothetical protein [Pseudomonas]|nr:MULTISPECIES: hypothetical protein [Pseudomonas]
MLSPDCRLPIADAIDLESVKQMPALSAREVCQQLRDAALGVRPLRRATA